MNRAKRIQLVNVLTRQLSDSGIQTAIKDKDIGVSPELAATDEFMTEYLQLQQALQRVRSLVRYSLGPTRDLKTSHLRECIAILTELVDKEEEPRESEANV